MADVLAPGTRDVRSDRIATSSVSTTEAEHSASDDGQATLQAHTKVQVTGNNRTKQSLIGRRGVVLQAGDLGGWHTLELETGETVRIQRNALVVLEQPSSSVVEQKLSDAAVSIPERVKQQAQRVSIKRPALLTPPREAGAGQPAARKRSSVPDKSIKATRINFNKLDSSALRRYCRHYQLIEVGPNTTRDELVNSVAGHFSRQVVSEQTVLASLVHSAGMRRRSLQALGP